MGDFIELSGFEMSFRISLGREWHLNFSRIQLFSNFKIGISIRLQCGMHISIGFSDISGSHTAPAKIEFIGISLKDFSGREMNF